MEILLIGQAIPVLSTSRVHLVMAQLTINITQVSKDFLFANELALAIGLGKVILSYDGNSVRAVEVPLLKSIT